MTAEAAEIRGQPVDEVQPGGLLARGLLTVAAVQGAATRGWVAVSSAALRARTEEVAVKAGASDELITDSRDLGRSSRTGTITALVNEDGAPPCVARWLSGYESLVVPGPNMRLAKATGPRGYPHHRGRRVQGRTPLQPEPGTIEKSLACAFPPDRCWCWMEVWPWAG